MMWDECAESNNALVIADNRTTQDWRNFNRLVGGVTFVFAGDFQQTLPVIARGIHADIVKACLRSSAIQTLNLRARLGGGDNDFLTELLHLGGGNVPNDDGFIEIDQKLGHVLNSTTEIIAKIYPNSECLLDENYTWLR